MCPVSDLIPCPFCGGEPFSRFQGYRDAPPGTVRVECTICGMYGPLANDVAAAADKWNTRPGERAAHLAGFKAGLAAVSEIAAATRDECRKKADAPQTFQCDREWLSNAASSYAWMVGRISAIDPALCDEIEALRARNAAEDALDQIAALSGCAEWGYPGQVVRDVERMAAEIAELRATLDNEAGRGEGPSAGWEWNRHARFWHRPGLTVYRGGLDGGWWWNTHPQGLPPYAVRVPFAFARDAMNEAAKESP